MAKRLMVLMGMLALMLAAAVPAMAQGQEGDLYETFSFELAVEGDPPEDTSFFGIVGGEGGGMVAPLADPDGDGTYTGGIEVFKYVPGFGPGATPTPIEVPVSIRQYAGALYGETPYPVEMNTIKDFGAVPVDEDRTFSASVSFDGGQPPASMGEGSATGVIEGTVTDISGSVVLVEEDPSDRGDPTAGPEGSPSSPKGFFTVTGETEITKQEDGASVPAAFEDLEVGQNVEAVYAGDVAQSYPTQGNAASIAILEEDGPPPGSSATFTYELAVECEPPADATFFGRTATESFVTTLLTDPDGDGVYTGSRTVPATSAGQGGPPEPLSLPVQMVQGTGTQGPDARSPWSRPGEPIRVIEDFGTVVAEDRTFSAGVSFCDGTEPVDPVDPAPVDPAPGVDADGNGSGGPVVSGDTANANKGGSGSVDTSGGGAAKDGTPSVAQEGGASPITSVLPATGGVLPAAGLVGLVIVAAGLLVRRISR
ncbi:MAG: YobA family protein [Actinomycetota bacterium]|nr:YobA family protein [Actinomycetota bacterium]